LSAISKAEELMYDKELLLTGDKFKIHTIPHNGRVTFELWSGKNRVYVEQLPRKEIISRMCVLQMQTINIIEQE